MARRTSLTSIFIPDNTDVEVSSDYLEDLIPMNIDIEVSPSLRPIPSRHVEEKATYVELDPDWEDDPRRLLVRRTDAAGDEDKPDNEVTYTGSEEQELRNNVQEMTKEFRARILDSAGAAAMAADRAAAEAEAILLDCFGLTAKVDSSIVDFASMSLDISMLSEMLTRAGNVQDSVKEAIVTKLANGLLDDWFVKRKIKEREANIRRISQTNDNLVGSNTAMIKTMSGGIHGQKAAKAAQDH